MKVTRAGIRLLKLLALISIIANIIYFSIQHLTKNDNLESIKKIYKTPYLEDMINRPFSQPFFNTFTHHTARFQRYIKEKFKEIENNKHGKYWLANTDLTEIDIEVEISKFLKDQGELKFEDENHWLNKNEIYYDPRLTLSIYLSALKHKYLEKFDRDGKVNHNEIIELPFNWLDWLDLTVLNDDLSKPMDQRITCHYIRQNTNNDPDPAYFCKDNSELSDEQVLELGFKQRSQLPGFIIHGHSSHDDRPFNDFRILEAKGYAFTQNLPKPLRVIMLTKEGGTFEFNVQENSSERLITSNLIHEYLETHNINAKSIKPDTKVHFNHIDEFENLKKMVAPKTLSDEEDINGMYRALKKSGDSKESKELELTKEMFHYPNSIIHDQIRFYEQENTVPLEQLSKNERLYYDGLKYCSSFDEKDEPTYFKMAVIRMDDDKNRDREWGWHYDWRFFNGALNYDRDGWTERELVIRTGTILDRLLRNWYRFAEEKGIVTWIMHGPLLSWYWDGLMFPFDNDIDIQMSAVELARLARDYNQTLIVEDPSEGYGKYLIDIGTFIHNRDISLNSNHIDGRFVDVDSGIYIDITGLGKSKANPPEEYNNNELVNIHKEFHDENAEVYNDRRKHFYTLDQLSPLRYSMLGGVPVYIPSTITNRIVFEYSNGLVNYEFNDWYYVTRLNLWLKQDQVIKAFNEKQIKNDKNEIDKQKLLSKINNISDKEIMKLLNQDDEILIEYYLTKELTDIHETEKQYLFDSLGRDNNELNTNKELKEKYNQLVSSFKMSKPVRKSLYDYESIEKIKHPGTT